MALDPDFFISPNLQENFTDKTTGAPLVNGTITFFKDEARTTPKDVFVLTGTSPNYDYTNIGNVVTLNNAGATSYLGQDARLYYFPEDEDGNIELYYAVVRNAAGTEQLTREAWPNIFTSAATGDNGDSAFSNYIPNGQFRSRNNLPDGGLIAGDVTQIAYGNWTFERPVGSNATDTLTFVRFNSYVDNPESHPRYAIKLVNTGGGAGDLSKDIRVKFDDASKFGSDTQQFTCKISARALSGTLDDVKLILIKNYGTGVGASPQTETELDSFSLGGSYQSFVTSFVFGGNTGKNFPLDDDFIQLVVRFPSGIVFDAEITNFVLVEGEFAAVNFPDTTTRQSTSQFLGGSFPIPDPDGLDLGLNIRLGLTGLEYDSSQISNYVFKSTETLEFGELWADGATYVTADKSADGIPFLRLQQKYFDAATRTALYGTGALNLSVYAPGEAGNLDTFLLVSNEPGVASVAVDGTAQTGFTFNLVYTGVASGNDVNAFISTAGNGYIQNAAAGAVQGPFTQTSGLSIATNVFVIGTTVATLEYDVIFDTAASLQNPGGVGKYWEFHTPPTNYYLWYSVTDETDPAPPGLTEVRVNININDDAVIVSEKTIFALNNLQTSYIETIDASSMTDSTYFEASIPSDDFYIWYTIDGAGTDPLVALKTGIQVDILGADNAQAVAEKTQTAINSRIFAVPDARELLFRGAAMGRNEIGLDEDQLFRFSRTNVKFGATKIGSEQLSINRSHKHDANNSVNNPFAVGGGAIILGAGGAHPTTSSKNVTVTTTILEDGRTESRPANMYVGVAIKY